mmetsp:Transcript_21615/g.50496  ORF Transcript_21615/g.50496 Transcript_21615/m.50496 type:complete len:217 (+) Transcript_21615:78-728(+)
MAVALMRALALLLLFTQSCVVATPHGISPPAPGKKAATARWITHNLDWGVMSTISTWEKTKGMPFGNPCSFADGPSSNSSGILYLYVSDMDQSIQDLAVNPSVSFSLSEASFGKLCEEKGLDPEDPPCARLTVSGKFEKVTDPDEINFAKAGLFERHPSMKHYPTSHDFFVGRIVPQSLWLIDFYGGAADVDIKEYFDAGVPSNVQVPRKPEFVLV